MLNTVVEKDKKVVMEDPKLVYNTVNEEIGYENLLKVEENWVSKHPLAAKSLLNNWTNLATYFESDG